MVRQLVVELHVNEVWQDLKGSLTLIEVKLPRTSRNLSTICVC